MANAFQFVIHDMTEEETKILSPRLLYYTRERHPSCSLRVWTLRRVESSHTPGEERSRVFRGQLDTREETTAEDGSSSLSACVWRGSSSAPCLHQSCNSRILFYNRVIFHIGSGYDLVATSPKSLVNPGCMHSRRLPDFRQKFCHRCGSLT